jgi:di/tricarboxylate transporter
MAFFIMQIVIVLGLLFTSIILFALEKMSVDIITLMLLMALVLTGILKPYEAFTGFSNEIIVILASIFVISGALALEPSCLLVYGPGKYRFLDFIKVGMLLSIILLAVILIMVPMIWPM